MTEIAVIGVATSAAWTAVALTLVGVGVLVAVLGRLDGQDDADDSGSDDGEGGLPSGSPPHPSDSGGEPLWWPEFERQFAECVARQRTAPPGMTARL